MDDKLKLLMENTKELLNFMKPRYRLYHLSNVFFRDMHYGVMSYLELRGVKYKYDEAEQLTRKWTGSLEQSNILKPVNKGAWMLNYPEFKKPSVKPAAPAPAKPAAAAAPRPAAAPTAKPAVAAPTVKPTLAPVAAGTPAAHLAETGVQTEQVKS